MQNQLSVAENAVFLYAAIVQTGSQRINKQIRNMTKVNATFNAAKPFIRTWKF